MKFPINLTTKPQKLFKWQFLTFWNQQKLISHKIRVVAWKIANFHIVEYPKSKFPIRLLRSVHIIHKYCCCYLAEPSAFCSFYPFSMYSAATCCSNKLRILSFWVHWPEYYVCLLQMYLSLRRFTHQTTNQQDHYLSCSSSDGTVWKLQNFSVTQIFSWNQCWRM